MNGTQTQEASSTSSGVPKMETASSTSSSSAVGGSEKDGTTNVPEQNESTGKHQRHPELSTDMMDEIRKFIRQEFLGTYAIKPPTSENGSITPQSAANTEDQRKTIPNPGTMAIKPQNTNEDLVSPMALPESRPPITSPTSPSLSLVVPTRSDQGKPGVRFTDGARASPSGSKKAPWAMYRRTTSSTGEPVPEWGILFDENGFVTARCAQVFRGLARSLAEVPPGSANLVTPEKLGLLYSRFKMEGEVYPFEGIFHPQTTGTDRLTTYYNRISDFFADLDCEYYLVPDTPVPLNSSSSTLTVSAANAAGPPPFPRSSSTSTLPPPRPRRPCVPALTLDGFARFFTICVLAHPDEEARRLDRIAGEMALVADSSSQFPLSLPSSSSSSPYQNQGPGQGPGPGSGPVQYQGQTQERLPRQFLRSLLPVKPDARSRKLLASAVEDLLCDLRLAESEGAGRRWSFSSLGGIPGIGEGIGDRNAGKNKTPTLPPPPVPLPRSLSAGATKPVSVPTSKGSLVKFTPSSPTTDRPYQPRHRVRRYDVNPDSTPRTTGTRFELGEEEETESSTSSDSTVTTVVWKGREQEKGKEKERFRDKEREREEDEKRRPPPAPRRHSERRIGTMSPGGTDERGPTWGEVIRAQTQTQSTQQASQPGQKVKAVTFSDEVERTYV